MLGAANSCLPLPGDIRYSAVDTPTHGARESSNMNFKQAERDFLDTARLFQEEKYEEALSYLDRLIPAFPNSIKLIQMREMESIILIHQVMIGFGEIQLILGV